MTYETYRYIFIGAAILCGAMFLTSVLLFILLKIPKVISDLTGRTARKAIESIRNQNEASGDKAYRSSPVNKERGRLTDKISPSGRLIERGISMETGAMATEKISTQKLATSETAVLDSANETTLLTAELAPGGSETTLLTAELAPGGNETTLLSQPAPTANVFVIEYEITYIHTNEMITAKVN